MLNFFSNLVIICVDRNLFGPIHLVIILVSNKSLHDYRPNWTPLNSVAITYHRYRYFYL